MRNNEVFCKDCKFYYHISIYKSPDFSLCKSNPTISYVDGSTEYSHCCIKNLYGDCKEFILKGGSK